MGRLDRQQEADGEGVGLGAGLLVGAGAGLGAALLGFAGVTLGGALRVVNLLPNTMSTVASGRPSRTIRAPATLVAARAAAAAP